MVVNVAKDVVITSRTIQSDIAALKKMGVLCRMEGRKKGYYEIISPHDNG